MGHPAIPSLAAAAVAFAASQGFGRFGFGLVLPHMRDALGLTNGQMGTLAGIGLAALLLTSLPSGVLAARFGTRPVVLAGLAAIALGLALTGLADGFLGAAVAQTLVGLGGPAVVVPCITLASRWVSPGLRGRAAGAVVAGGGLGLLLAGLIVPPLLAAGDPRGWRRAWWALGAATLAAGAVAALFLRDPRGGPSLRPGPSIGGIYRIGAVWRLAFVFGLYGVTFIVYGTFFAAHLQAEGIDAGTIGLLWSLAGVVAAGSGLLGGALADRFGPPAALVAMFAMQGIGLVLLALGGAMGGGVAPFALSALAYGGSLWGFPSAVTKACAELVGPRRAPAAMGLLSTMFSLGQAIGPVVAGMLADLTGSLAPGLLFGAGAGALGAAGALLLPKGGARAPEPQRGA